MPISMECPSCMYSFSLPDEMAGRKSKCPECQFGLFVPHGDTLVETPPTTAPQSSDPAPATPAPSIQKQVQVVEPLPLANAAKEGNNTPAPSKKKRQAIAKKPEVVAEVPAVDNPFDFRALEANSAPPVRRRRRGMGLLLLLGFVIVALGGLLLVGGGAAAAWFFWLRPIRPM